MTSSLRRFCRNWVPPGVLRAASRLFRSTAQPEWQVAPRGWETPTRGWAVAAVVSAQLRRLVAYKAALTAPAPLVTHPEAHIVDSEDLGDSATALAFAYVLLLAARGKDRLGVLDWGGGIGQYFLLATAAVPGVALDYTVQETEPTCAAGERAVPEVRFLSEPGAFTSRTYDLVLASSSLWYAEDWRTLIERLVSVTDDYLYLTRMVFVTGAPSFVALQRPVGAGYDTEYLCWILNRDELVGCVESHGMELVREFLLARGPFISGAPEQGLYRGFLFRRRPGAQQRDTEDGS